MVTVQIAKGASGTVITIRGRPTLTPQDFELQLGLQSNTAFLSIALVEKQGCGRLMNLTP